jgi:lauroyl/myristoyl acyltransferase
MTTPLSPAAQAVLDAYGHCLGSYEAQVNTTNPGAARLAASLQAAVDQVVPEENVDDADYHCLYAKWAAEGKQEVRDEMLAIAAELKNTPQPS